jgi:hypothetical protein
MRKAYRHARLAPNPLYARVVPLLPRFTATLQQIEDEQKVAANVLEASEGSTRFERARVPPQRRRPQQGSASRTAGDL